MKTVIVIIVVLLVLAALAAAVVSMYRKQRSSQLQERFGPEYDRAVGEAGSKREAEQHLSDVAHRRDELTIRDLDDAEQARFSGEWDVVQARFVDEPGQTVDAAEVLITTVMRERGYPVDTFDEQADLVAVDHPDVVQHYRDAHAAHERHRSAGGVQTEDLRQSFVHYRALFAVLVRNEDPSAATAQAVAADPSATTPDAVGSDAAAPEVGSADSTAPAGSEDSAADHAVVADADSADATTATAPVLADRSGSTVTDSPADSATQQDVVDVDSVPNNDARPSYPQETR